MLSGVAVSGARPADSNESRSRRAQRPARQSNPGRQSISWAHVPGARFVHDNDTDTDTDTEAAAIAMTMIAGAL
jgi:hypothetical protein